ncbi:uncharacterized protein M421DRAFT_88607 [Didymella exigua CBS 183.55]|uniref:Uncharacterized protein n=1 Tax=Didymella exigua CBS 183.55 TaxID=1150837 RepID=A0A6A5RYC5_9PLEO|nr:uncharacterized protein M421DRAFT_88607 [Didymella exigua CBS 183.55]KAF1933381.1 hypothetical protein M421DRAFT_88607 [Didymella exigua CBS 183.55]
MHSCITAFLFILATLSSALEVSSSPRPSNSLLALQSSTSPASICIERFTTYFYASYNYVFFNDPAEPEYNFTIVTSHVKFYPATLAKWLEEREFDVLTKSRATADWLCGWHIEKPVVVDGRRHGTVGWKRNPAFLNTSSLHAGDASSLKAAPRQVIPPYTSIRPRHLTLERVEAILRDNTPYADIYYFRCMMLGMACGMIAGTLVWYALMGFAEMRRRDKKLKAARKSDDIELDQIKVHDLSGAGMERMDANRDDGLELRIEIVKPTSDPPSGSSVADPPPVYTLDGAGRLPVRARDMV